LNLIEIAKLPNAPELIRIRHNLAFYAKLSVEFRIPPFSGGICSVSSCYYLIFFCAARNHPSFSRQLERLVRLRIARRITLFYSARILQFHSNCKQRIKTVETNIHRLHYLICSYCSLFRLICDMYPCISISTFDFYDKSIQPYEWPC